MHRSTEAVAHVHRKHDSPFCLVCFVTEKSFSKTHENITHSNTSIGAGRAAPEFKIMLNLELALNCILKCVENCEKMNAHAKVMRTANTHTKLSCLPKCTSMLTCRVAQEPSERMGQSKMKHKMQAPTRWKTIAFLETQRCSTSPSSSHHTHHSRRRGTASVLNNLMCVLRLPELYRIRNVRALCQTHTHTQPTVLLLACSLVRPRACVCARECVSFRYMRIFVFIRVFVLLLLCIHNISTPLHAVSRYER